MNESNASGGKSPRKPMSFRFFKTSGSKRKARQPTRAELRELDRALPIGTYWREEVLAGRAEYPPPGANPPPRVCDHAHDRGRLYPHYYVVHRAPACAKAPSKPMPHSGGERRPRCICTDCINNAILERQLWLRREESRCDAPAPKPAIVPADEADPDEFISEDELALSLGASDSSGSAQGIEVLRNYMCRDEAGRVHYARLIELPLATVDEGQLKRQIARYLAGKRTSLIQPLK